MSKIDINTIKFDEKGLVPVVTQDVETKKVLMLAYMNMEALKKTIETNQVHYYSRSRAELWLKGETSGHYQNVVEITVDCDLDTLLIYVKQVGSACHTGEKTCFYRNLDGENPTALPKYEDMLKTVYDVIMDRKNNPVEGSYTNYLFDKGIDKMLKKVGEESAEIIIAAKNPDNHEIVYEIGDMMYHVSVVMAERGIAWADVYKELEKRR